MGVSERPSFIFAIRRTLAGEFMTEEPQKVNVGNVPPSVFIEETVEERIEALGKMMR